MVLTVATFMAGCTGLGADQTRAVDITFESMGVTLAGTLRLPDGPGPFPAMVTAHGSGRITRNGQYLKRVADFYVPRGMAVLSFDKRGVGESGGTYPGSYSSSMVLYGVDVMAGVRALQDRADIRADQIGLWGLSQAGWVIPVAAALDQDAVAFTIIVSGPTVSIVEENLYSELTGLDAGRPSGLSAQQIDQRMSQQIPLGLDASAFIAELRMPGLWLYGDLDQSVPWRQGVEDLRRIKAEWNRDFTWHVFANANHGMMRSQTGGTWERPTPNQLVDGFFERQAAWLREHVGIPLRE